MSINLLESVQKHLSYAHLHRLSANSQSGNEMHSKVKPEMLDQACISAVLAGLYQFTRDEDEAAILLRTKSKQTWLEVIFDKYPNKLEDKIVSFTGCEHNQVKQHLFVVAETAIMEIRNALGSTAKGKDVKHFMTTQRNHILSYLPGFLKVGDIVNNSSLDDVTNKMHGPFSDFMHWIEEFLAEPQKPLY